MIQTTKQNARAAHRWFRVQNRFMELATGIGPLGIAVYVCLAWRADQDGTCYPSLSKIAADVGISRRAVIRVIKTLASTGLLQVKSRSMNGKMQSNVYILATLANGDSQSPLTG